MPNPHERNAHSSPLLKDGAFWAVNCKPGPGMILEAMDHFGVSREDTLMVGDREEDKLAAENASVSFSWSWDYFGEGPIIA